MFNTKGVEGPKQKQSSYMSVGDQVAMIKSIELKEARSGSKQVVFHMETPPIEDADFKPVEGAKGAVGRVQASIYLKDDNAKVQWVTERMLPIAESLGIREDLDKIESANFEDYISKIENLLKDKPHTWLIGGEEFVNQKAEIRVRLMLPRYNFVGDVPKFNKADKYHFRPYVDTSDYTGSANNEGAATDDLPF